MSSKARKRLQWEANDWNHRVFYHYMNTLKEICCNMFKWENLPPEIDERFLELMLFETALVVFFHDDERIRLRADSSDPMFNGDTDRYIAVQGAPGGPVNMYHNPTKFRAYGPGGFSRLLDADECVPIWGNFLREPLHNSLEVFARRLTNIDRTFDVNLNAQKTPVMIAAPESMRLTMKNFYAQYEENQPVIYVSDSLAAQLGETPAVTAIKVEAPYVGDKLLADKGKVWGEIMTFLGIDNANQEKRERLVANEVEANNGQIEISRLRGLDARRLACKQIKEKYGLDISVNFNYDWMSANFRFENDAERQAQMTAQKNAEKTKEKVEKTEEGED